MSESVRRIASREIHQGRLVRLREDTVILPKGSQDTYEYVEIKPGSSTLAIEDDGDVWLVKEWKYAVARWSLETVSGGIEPGEEPVDAARRELREEAGLAATEWIPLGFVDPFTTMLRCPNYLFVARGLSAVEREPEEAETHMQVLRMPMERAVAEVLEGRITHATSCTLILKAAAWLRGERQKATRPIGL